MVCGDVCCAPAPGLSADNIVCNAGFCECTYSCASAGCGGGDGFIVNTCGSDPQPQCHNSCNVPDDDGCADLVCEENETHDLDTCTCIPNDDGCGDMTCNEGETLDFNTCTCVPNVFGGRGCLNPLTNCGDAVNLVCVDIMNDPLHCGICFRGCPGECIEGNCIVIP